MSLSPETEFYAKLLTLFPADSIAPAGTVVYNASGDPILPYVLYRRVSTEVERALDSTPLAQHVEVEVSIASKFFIEVAGDMSSLDHWTAGGWYVEELGQVEDEENYRIVYVYSCSKGI